jgi:uncharacterized membrane protein
VKDPRPAGESTGEAAESGPDSDVRPVDIALPPRTGGEVAPPSGEATEVDGRDAIDAELVEEAAAPAPLPAPQVLAGYEMVVPGLAREIVDMLTDETAHRQALEREQMQIVRDGMEHERARTRRGQYLGFGIAIVFAAVAVYAISKGSSLAGAATAITAIGGLVSVFIYATRTNEKVAEREAKEHEAEDASEEQRTG